MHNTSKQCTIHRKIVLYQGLFK